MSKTRQIAWYDKVVVATTLDAYWACGNDSMPSDKDPTATYERDYGPLEKRIGRVLKKHRVPSESIDFFDDWCPNLTRIVSVEQKYISASVLIDVYGLLRNKYEDWQIEVILVNSIEKHKWLGALSMRKNWVLCYGVARKLLNEVKRIYS